MAADWPGRRATTMATTPTSTRKLECAALRPGGGGQAVSSHTNRYPRGQVGPGTRVEACGQYTLPPGWLELNSPRFAVSVYASPSSPCHVLKLNVDTYGVARNTVTLLYVSGEPGLHTWTWTHKQTHTHTHAFMHADSFRARVCSHTPVAAHASIESSTRVSCHWFPQQRSSNRRALPTLPFARHRTRHARPRHRPRTV